MKRSRPDADCKKRQALDEELIEVLFAISVITKRLAMKINAKQEEKQCTDIMD